MSSSEHEDYLLRQIRMLAAALARIVGLRVRGQVEEARAELEQSYTLLLGPETDLIRSVDSATAAGFLGSAEKIAALAQLLNEEAEQEADDGRRAILRTRAAELAHEAARRDPESETIDRFLKKLAAGAGGGSTA
jgi:hypothetical protein